METIHQSNARRLLSRQLRNLEKTNADITDWDKWFACVQFAKDLHIMDADTYCGFLARYAMRLSADGRP